MFGQRVHHMKKELQNSKMMFAYNISQPLSTRALADPVIRLLNLVCAWFYINDFIINTCGYINDIDY